MATKRTAPARRKTAAKPGRKAAPRRKAGAAIQVISPCLWFDGQAEEAARFYVSVFPKGRIGTITRFPNVGQETHGREPGSVMTVAFEINGMPFVAMNGGPLFRFNEAVSLMVLCRTQAEIDYYWEKLGEGGDERARQCGWLKDRYGLSWQVCPAGWEKLYKDPTSRATERAFAAMMEMKKLDIAALRKAARG